MGYYKGYAVITATLPWILTMILPAKVQPDKQEEASLNGIYYRPPTPIPHERHSKAWIEAQEQIKQPAKKKTQKAKVSPPKPESNTVPEKAGSGLCECGCGQITRKAKQTVKSKRLIKGQYQRFVLGHYSKLPLGHPLKQGIPTILTGRKEFKQDGTPWGKRGPMAQDSQSKVLMRMLEGFTKDMLTITKRGDIKTKLLTEMTKDGADPDFVKWFAKEIMGLAKKYFDVTSTEMKINATNALAASQSQHGGIGAGVTNIFIIKGLHDDKVIDIGPTRNEDQQEVTDAQFEAIGLTAEEG